MSELAASSGTATTLEADPLTRRQKILRALGWLALGLGSLIFFSILKLPEARLKAYLHGQIASQLAAQGIGFSASSSNLSILLGLQYELEGVTLTFPPPALPVKIDSLSVSPSLTSLILGKPGGSISIEQGDSSIDGSFGARLSGGNLNAVSLDLDFAKVNLARLGVFAAGGLQGSAVLDGNVDVSVDWNELKASKGTISLKLNKGVIEAQTIMGFPIPRLVISEGKLEAEIQGEAVKVKELKLGKSGSQDDLIAALNGVLTLNRSFLNSAIDLTANLSISESLNKSFALLGALLAAGKQKDGSYSYKLSGSLSAPFPTPIPAQ